MFLLFWHMPMSSVPDAAALNQALLLWNQTAKRENMVDYGAGNYTYVQSSIPKSTYETYCRKLVDNGYVQYHTTNQDNGLNGVMYQNIFKKGTLVLTVVFEGTVAQPSNGTVHISANYNQPLSVYLVKGNTSVSNKVQTTSSAYVSLHMLKTNKYGNSFVIQLKNGHFIVNDGGDKGELKDLLNYLRTLAGKTNGVQNPVVIEAWTISHFHTDHMALFRDIWERTASLEQIYVEGFYVNQPSNDKCNQDDNPNDIRRQIALFTHVIRNFRTTSGKVPEIYRYEAGQRYYFGSITMDVLFTQDLLSVQPLSDVINEFNDTSTWLRFEIEGKSILIAGDAEATSIKKMREIHGAGSYLQPDVFVAFHHGINTYEPAADHGIKLFVPNANSEQRILIPQNDKENFAQVFPTRYQYLTENTNSRYRYWSCLGTVKLTFTGTEIQYAQTP